MPTYTRSEFADVCGVTSAYIKMYINRGKIVAEENGDIIVDKDHVLNHLFLVKRKDKEKVVVPVKKKVETKNQVIPNKPKPKVSESEKKARDSIQRSLFLETRTKEADLEKKELDINIKKIELAKKKGESIPTELARTVMRNHFKSVTKAFHQGADNLLAVIAKRAGIKKSELSELRGDLIDIVNESVKEAQEDSKAEIKSIIQEYAAKRGVGQSS